MNQEKIRAQVSHACAEWSAAQTRASGLRSSVDTLASELEAISSEIRGLVADKRAATRSEKGYYRSLIDTAKETRSSIVADLRQQRAALSAAISTLQQLRASERTLRSQIASELSRLNSGAAKLSGQLPRDMADLRRVVSAGRQFCAHQIDSLNAAFRGSGPTSAFSADDVEFVSDQPSWFVVGPKPNGENPLHLIEAPSTESYVTRNSAQTVECETFRLFDTQAVDNLSTEAKALHYVDTFLQARGHRVAMSVGGPGLPDVISLDSAGRLWISEVKGTMTSGKLSGSGLKRTLGSESGSVPRTTMFENAAEWLSRRGPGFDRVDQVLAAINSAIDSSKEPGHQLELRELRERYRDAALQGFNPLICDKQLVQVGFQQASDDLAPPSALRSGLLDDYIQDVSPAKIVQMEVMIGSAASELFEPPPTSALADTASASGAPEPSAASGSSDASSQSATGASNGDAASANAAEAGDADGA